MCIRDRGKGAGHPCRDLSEVPGGRRRAGVGPRQGRQRDPKQQKGEGPDRDALRLCLVRRGILRIRSGERVVQQDVYKRQLR